MSKIGVFDSGYGGLTILKEFKEVLPNYDYVYLGDNARAPYGTRSFDVVFKYTLECVEFLFSKGCDLVILACNTASAKALRTIQQDVLPVKHPGKRVLGVIRPSTELVGSLSKEKAVGILATSGTIKSNSYAIELAKYSPEVKVYQKACPLWVPLIENNEWNTEEGKAIIKKDLNCLLSQDPKIDVIVLACTHYPILLEFLKKIVKSNVKIVSQGEIVADRLKDYLQRHLELEKSLTKNATDTFFTSERISDFKLKLLELGFTSSKVENFNC